MLDGCFQGSGSHVRATWSPQWVGFPQGSQHFGDLASALQVDEQIHACYAQTMSEWLGCEAIVRQRERESHAAALAKCSSGASLDGHLHRMMHRDSTISNEVMGAHLREWRVGCESQDPLHQAVVGMVRAACLEPGDRASPLVFG